jgi:hypothetical protein
MAWSQYLLAGVLVFCLSFDGEAAQEVFTLGTRPSAPLKVLVVKGDTPPAAILILFPGGDGKGHFKESDGKIQVSHNFLVRSSQLFVDQGFLVAIADVPSDRRMGMSDHFRMGDEHALDIKKVIDFLTQKWPGPVYLVGTSRGTLSVAYLGAALKDDRISGLVLTSSIGASQGRQMPLNISHADLDKITLPVLFVHHREDGCWASTMADALKNQRHLFKAAKTDFIEVLGGDPPRSNPCEPLSPHGFLGKEREVVAAIADWIRGKPVPKQIGP